jgi:hypothetical protein
LRGSGPGEKEQSFAGKVNLTLQQRVYARIGDPPYEFGDVRDLNRLIDDALGAVGERFLADPSDRYRRNSVRSTSRTVGRAFFSGGSITCQSALLATAKRRK